MSVTSGAAAVDSQSSDSERLAGVADRVIGTGTSWPFATAS